MQLGFRHWKKNEVWVVNPHLGAVLSAGLRCTGRVSASAGLAPREAEFATQSLGLQSRIIEGSGSL